MIPAVWRARFRNPAAIVGFAAMVGALGLSTHPATAQEASAQPAPSQEITVIAPRVVAKIPAVKTKPMVSEPIGVVSVTRHVTYGDLDLTKPDDADELRKRIRDTAKAACDQLEAEYPSALYPPAPEDQNCVKAATDPAMAVAIEIIDAAAMQVR